MSFQDFTAHYKKISNAELLDILQNTDSYQPEAITAAKKEFEDRQLSEEEIEAAQQIADDKKIKAERKKEKLKAAENKIKETGFSMLDTLNPVQQEKATAEKKIKIIVLFFAATSLYQLITKFKYILLSLKDLANYPLIVIIDISPLIVLPVAIFLFWKRKTAGWIMLAIFLTYSSTLSLRLLADSFKYNPSRYVFFRSPSTVSVLALLFLMGGTLYVICRPDVRQLFSVGKNKMITTLIITWIATFLLLFLSYL